MKEILFVFRKSKIFNDVSISSAYAGAKNVQSEPSYQKVAVVEADEALLTGFWMEICGKVSDFYREFIRDSNCSSEEFSVVMEVSGAYQDSLTPSIENDISSAISAGITARWFRFTFPAQVAEWEKQSDTLLRRALSKLCYRPRPQKRP